jgi:hypothetical protein
MPRSMQQGHQQQQEDIAPPGELPYFSAVLRIRITVMQMRIRIRNLFSF